MNRGKIFAYLLAIGLGLWMTFSFIEIIDGLAAEEASSLTTTQRK